MKITLELSLPLSDEDKAALRALMGDATVAVEQQAATPAKKTAAAPAKKAAAAKPAPEPEPEPEDEPEPEPEADEEEDLLGGEPTMADAVKLATELVSSGKAADVKAALAKVGAKRVSELKESDIATFVNSLS